MKLLEATLMECQFTMFFENENIEVERSFDTAIAEDNPNIFALSETLHLKSESDQEILSLTYQGVFEIENTNPELTLDDMKEEEREQLLTTLDDKVVHFANQLFLESFGVELLSDEERKFKE